MHKYTKKYIYVDYKNTKLTDSMSTQVLITRIHQCSSILIAMSDNNELLVLNLFYYKKAKNRREKVASKYKNTFNKSLSRYQKYVWYNNLPWVSLQDPFDTTWTKLYSSNNNQALITLTCRVFEVFHSLVAKFQPLFDAYSP